MFRAISSKIIFFVKRLIFREILVLGDSHAEVFKHREFKANSPKYFFNVIAIGGATVSGLENPNSVTQTLLIVRNALKNSRADMVITMFGEVDTGFVIWYRAEKYKASVDSMTDRALHNYQILLSEISKRFKVICISTPLPTIQDRKEWGEVANQRKEIKATQMQRTALTLMFNKRMQEFCRENDIGYLMLDDAALDEDGLVKKEFLNSDPKNHHYNEDKFAALILSKLKILIGEINPPVR